MRRIAAVNTETVVIAILVSFPPGSLAGRNVTEIQNWLTNHPILTKL